MAPAIVDATIDPTQPVTAVSSGLAIWVRATSDCGHGDRITMEPADAGSIIFDIRAKDGLVVAAEVRPLRPNFHILAEGSTTFDLTVALPDSVMALLKYAPGASASASSQPSAIDNPAAGSG